MTKHDATTPKVHARSSLGLRDTLFDTLDSLNSKAMSPQEAQAICKVAAQIINSVNTEIEYFKHVQRAKDAGEAVPNLVLQLGSDG